LQCLAVTGFRDIKNALNIVPKWGYASGGDVVSQEVELSDGEHALL
jgi:hypothetical protein